MNEAGSGGAKTRRSLIARSIEDEKLRQRLLDDPRATIEQELGKKMPEGLEIRVVEETPETVYLVLPPRASALREGGELSDRELENVAGGLDQDAGKETLPLCTVGEGCWKEL